jgi:DNA-binding transcriptional LysR family regulator
VASAGEAIQAGGHRVVVAAPSTFARRVLLPRLPAFQAAHPEVDVAVEPAIPLHDVQAGGVDVEVRFGRGLYPEFVTLDLLDEPVFPVSSPQYACQVQLATPADLARAVLLRSALEPWAPWFAAAGLRWPEPATGPRYEDLALLYEAAASGTGVALARASLAAPMLQGRALIRPFDICARSPHAYYLVCRPSALSRPEVVAFVDWLHEALQAAA